MDNYEQGKRTMRVEESLESCLEGTTDIELRILCTADHRLIYVERLKAHFKSTWDIVRSTREAERLGATE